MIAEMKGGPFEISAMFNRDASTEIHRELGNSLNWFSELLAFSRNLANHYPTTHILAKQKTSCCKLDFDFYLWEAIF